MEKQKLSRFDCIALVGLFFLTGIFSFVIHFYVLQSFPNSADEWAYLYQARTFALGQMSVEAHPQQERLSPFYLHTHEGRVFSIFPPGWPAILALGEVIHFPGLINPLLSALTVVILYLAAYKWEGRLCAWFAVGMLVCSSFFLFNAASYFSHPACLLACGLTFYFLISWRQNPSWIYAVAAGITFGIAFTIRELTALAVLSPLFIEIFYHSRRRFPFFLLAFLGALPIALAYLFYNAELTGRWFYPVRFLLPSESLGFGPREIQLFDYVEIQHFGLLDAMSNSAHNFMLLLRWAFPGLPFLALYSVWKEWRKPFVPWLLISAMLLPCAYFFYPSQGGNQYGPRFYYSALLPLTLLAGFALQHLVSSLSLKKITIILTFLFTISLTLVIYYSIERQQQIYERRTLFRLVEHFNLRNALVFVSAPSGDMTQGDLIRNSPRLDQQQVIYAWHLGERNQALLQSFPERIPYIFGRDSKTGSYFLRRMSSRLGDREGFM